MEDVCDESHELRRVGWARWTDGNSIWQREVTA
jgi:hypothetical protein